MSVLSQARSTLSTIGGRFKSRTAVAANADKDVADAVSRVNGAEGKTRTVAGIMSRMESDSKADLASVQAVIAQTRTADAHKAIAACQAAQTKAKAARDELAGLEESYKQLREKAASARSRVSEAKAAQAQAAHAIGQTASSL